METRVLGFAGWSGAGKTTLIKVLLREFAARAIRTATIKHAHHEFDVDVPGKDSYEHRRAGAGEVIVSSGRRWVQMHELLDENEPTLADLLRRVSPCDLILVEGFKRERHPKLEIHRPALGKPLLYPDDPHIVAIATDEKLPGTHPPAVDLNDVLAVTQVVLAKAQPLTKVLFELQ